MSGRCFHSFPLGAISHFLWTVKPHSLLALVSRKTSLNYLPAAFQNKMLFPRQYQTVQQKGLLKLLLKSRKIYDVWNILPFTYSEKEQKFSVKPPKALRRIRWKLGLSVTFTFVSFLQTVHMWSAITLPKLLQCWFYILFSSCGCYTIYDQLNNCEDIVALLNGMMVFEKERTKGTENMELESVSLRKRLCIPLIKTLTFAGTFIPVMGQVSFARNPCVAIQPGFFLLNTCNPVNGQSPLLPPTSPFQGHPVPLPHKLVMLPIGLITLCSRAFMLNSFLPQMCIGVIIKPYCLHSYCLLISDLASSSFSLGCMLFRHFQLLIQNYNNVYRRSVACILLFIVCEGTLSMYACVSLGAFLPTERRVIFGYTALNMFLCVTMIYGTLAAITEEAVNFLETFKRRHQVHCGKRVNRKVLRSYPVLRISLAAGWVETSTPLECQHLIIDQTVNLTLID